MDHELEIDLASYFESVKGIGILATANEDGQVDQAIYAKPHIAGPNTVIFVMKQRLSHKNLKSNLNASYLFMEEGRGYKGIRMYMTVLREEINQTLAESIRKQKPEIYPPNDDSNKYVVLFEVHTVRPLIGDFKEK